MSRRTRFRARKYVKNRLWLAPLVAVSFVDWFIVVLPAWVAVVSLFILRRERARR
jgi:hypothetical protein